MRILPSGSAMSSQIRHSFWCLGLATSNEYAPASILSISGATSRIGRSDSRGPWLSP